MPQCQKLNKAIYSVLYIYNDLYTCFAARESQFIYSIYSSFESLKKYFGFQTKRPDRFVVLILTMEICGHKYDNC